MAKSKGTRKPVHRRVDGVNYIIYANGDVRRDLRGGCRSGSGRKSLEPENKELHALKLSPKSSSILASVSTILSSHSDRKVTKRDVVSLIVHKAMLSQSWIETAFDTAQFVPAGEEFIRIRQADYEKILEIKESLLAKRGVKLTPTRLLNVLIYLIGAQVKSAKA